LWPNKVLQNQKEFAYFFYGVNLHRVTAMPVLNGLNQDKIGGNIFPK